MELIILGVNTKENLYVQADDDSVAFTVITEEKTQHNFDINLNEWERLKIFIDLQIKQEQNDKIQKETSCN